MIKKRKLFFAFISKIFGFCPQCNSDAPNIDMCEVCNGDRLSPFGKIKRKKYWEKYKKYVDYTKNPIDYYKSRGYSDEEVKNLKNKSEETLQKCKEWMDTWK
jgi:hypothetical protein